MWDGAYTAAAAEGLEQVYPYETLVISVAGRPSPFQCRRDSEEVNAARPEDEFRAGRSRWVDKGGAVGQLQGLRGRWQAAGRYARVRRAPDHAGSFLTRPSLSQQEHVPIALL